MPNWCYNTATVYNEDKTKIDGLEQELLKDKAEPFNYLRPNPAGEWDYGWSCENWGTKWDVSMMDWEREGDNSIVMHFDSAWSPPIAMYEYLNEEGWEVSAYYHEPGMGFAGRYDNGDDDYYEFDFTDRQSIEELPEDILDFTNAMEDLERYEEEQYEESIADLERTEWYPVTTNPDKIGTYEVKRKDWDYAFKSEWDGKEWQQEDVAFWRGLAENPEDWDPVAELDKIVSPE
jgi:hypothetical protein